MTAPTPLYLALDQGGHSSRALVMTPVGEIVARAQVSIDTHILSDVCIEHSAVELADSLKFCCAEIAHDLGKDCARINGAGLATQRSSITCWERSSGAALSPVLSWQDRRAAHLIECHQPQSGLVKALTGLVMSPHYGASKLQWCLENLDDVIQAQANRDLTIGPLASYLVRALTGSSPDVCDPANASRTLLWDRHARDWSPKLCELFNIDRALLPQSVPTRHTFGDVAVGDYDVPLRLVTGDQSAAIYAFGHSTKNVAYINLGTGAFVQCPIGQHAADVDGLLNSVAYQDEQRIEYVLEGTVNGAGRALTWWSDQREQDSKSLVKAAVGRLASDTSFERDVPVFINGISGLGSPYWLSHVESGFMRTDSQAFFTPDDAAGAIAILDSIAFLLNANIERAARHIQRFDQLVLTGGLASVDYLCQTVADVSGIATVRSSLREATAKGIGFLLSMDVDWPGPGQLTRFAPAPNPCLTDRHAAWQKHMVQRVLNSTV